MSVLARAPRIIVIAVVLAAAVLTLVAAPPGHPGRLRLTAAHTHSAACFGAAALDPGAACPASTWPPVPAPAKAGGDRSAAYDVRANGKTCWSTQPTFPRNTCHFGVRHGKLDVMLTGNSHAGEWLPALQRIARHQDWRITTELVSQCAFADVDQAFPDEAVRTHCRNWVRHAAVRVRRERPDLIVFANRMSLPAEGHSLDGSVGIYAAGIARVMRRWKGIPIVLIRDTPAPGDGGIDSVPDCLIAHPDDVAACSGPRATWVPADPGRVAAERLHHVRVVNLNDHICGPRICSAVVGGVIPYFDGSHLSATYSRTLAPDLKPALLAALRQAHRG